MFGRGAADMKAGIVAMLGAVRALRDVGLRGDVLVETVIEEECTGNGAAACRARCPRTDAALIPEPFDHAAMEAQVGVLWARLTVHGKAAHAERADQAVNAVLAALPVIERIKALEAEVNREPRSRWFADHPHPLNYNVGVIQGGDWASSVPEECVLEVRIAADVDADLDEVMARFEAAVARPGRVARLPRARVRPGALVADLRRPRPRALGGARVRAGVARVHRDHRRARLRGPRGCPRRRVTGRSAATCTRRTSGSTWRACGRRRTSWLCAAAEWCA